MAKQSKAELASAALVSVADAVGYAVPANVRADVAGVLAGATDDNAQGRAATFRERVVLPLANIKALKGKPLPEADAGAILDLAVAQWTAKGCTADSIKAMKSKALKLVTCAPVLPAAFEKLPALKDEGINGLAAFCTELKSQKFNAAAAVAAWVAEAPPVDANAKATDYCNRMLKLDSLTAVQKARIVELCDLNGWAPKEATAHRNRALL